MNKYLEHQFASEEQGATARLRLGGNEQLLASYPTMLAWQALLWIALLFGSSGSLLGLAIVIALVAPGGEGLSLYDRVLRLVLSINSVLFGPYLVHLTDKRLVIDLPGQAPAALSLRNIAGTETRSFRPGGNLLVHLSGATKRRASLWVVQPREVAAQIRHACQGGR